MADLFNPQAPAPIKVLSLWQPWASLMAIGIKPDETRHWPARYRGRLAIHAAQHMEREDAPTELCDIVFGRGWAHRLPRSAILSIGELTACRPTLEVVPTITAANFASGNFKAGRFAFRVDNMRALIEPITLKGRQGFFNWTPPEDLESRLGPVVDHLVACRQYGVAA